MQIQSIAVPPLGCGLGGLDWSQVKPMIEAAFFSLPDVRVIMFEPRGTPEAKTMPVRTKRPKMTPARALFVKLMEAYSALDYSRTLLEVQKLAYFLQAAGEPLRLKYEPGHYGPYAPNLNKVLEVMEGHFTRGYGDSQKPGAEIELLPGATGEATDFLRGKEESNPETGRGGRAHRRFRNAVRHGAIGHCALDCTSRWPKSRASSDRAGRSRLRSSQMEPKKEEDLQARAHTHCLGAT